MTATHSPLFDLTGKSAVVTGGAGLIGTQICRGFAQHGAAVAVVDINGEAASELAANLHSEFDVRAIGITCDVGSPESVAAMAAQVSRELGGIHVLHNNAATKGKSLAAFFAPFEEYALETWDEIMRVDLDGMFLVAQAVGRRMVAQGAGGSIIQTGSIYGIVAPDPKLYTGSEYLGRAINTPAVYAAAKAAITGLSRYLATYWAPQGIRVNTLVPGGVESGQNETFQRNYAARTPLGRMARRDELAGAAVYLASDASSYVTGQTIVVDGGWSVW
jgi:NAD(P)-dependent dehydrogenase (short-subunit alcohol dehydrogenase family)